MIEILNNMDYNELTTKEKQSVNGKIAQYMDVYIRQNKVWTPEQMCIDFLNEKKKECSSKWFATITDSVRRKTLENSLSWLLSPIGQKHVLERMNNKYIKDNDIALRESPIAERVRFGQWPGNLYDISYGLKGSSGFNRMTTEELRLINYSAWTVEHVEDVLQRKYNKHLREIYNELPLNHYEIDFSDYWFNNLYSLNKPALLPFINGLRPSFYCLEYNGKFYKNFNEIGIDSFDPNIKSIRFRFDFMLVNTFSKKSCFIDITPDTFPVNEKDKSLSTIKQCEAKENGFEYILLRQIEIKDSLSVCFSKIESIVR